jgi:hypothetical protein
MPDQPGLTPQRSRDLPYVKWSDRHAVADSRLSADERKKVYAKRYDRKHASKIARKKRDRQAFESGIRKLGERLAAGVWLNDLPTYLWYPRCVSIECRPDQQIFMGMR